MLLKSARKIFNVKSISGQLTLFYSLLTFSIIVMISALLYLAINKILIDAENQFINDEIKIVNDLIIKKPNDHSALIQEVKEIPNSLSSSVYHYYIRVLDENNNIVSQTPSMDKNIPS